MCRSLTSASGVVVSSDDAVPQGTSAPAGFAPETSGFLDVDSESLAVAIRDAFHPVFLQILYITVSGSTRIFCFFLLPCIATSRDAANRSVHATVVRCNRCITTGGENIPGDGLAVLR